MFEFFKKLLRGINRMNHQLEALTAEIELTRGVMASAAILIGNLADRIDELKDDPEQLAALAESLREERTQLAAAIEADGDLAQARANERARLAADERRREERQQSTDTYDSTGTHVIFESPDQSPEEAAAAIAAGLHATIDHGSESSQNTETSWTGQGGDSGGAGASGSYSDSSSSSDSGSSSSSDSGGGGGGD